MGHSLWAIDLNSESKVGRAFPIVNWFEFRIDGIETTTIGMTHPTLWHINRFRDIGKMFTVAAKDKRI